MTGEKRKDPARERRRREFDQRLFEYVSAFVAGPLPDSRGLPSGDVDKWRDRLRELSADLFDQASP